MSKKNKSDVEVLEEKVRDLNKIIRQKDRTIRQLKSEVKTAEQAFNKTEIYLREVTDGRPLSEVLRTAEAGKPLSKLGENCPICGKSEMKKILFTKFHIVSCTCGYRTKISEEQEINQTQ